ncbi:MAG: type IV secretory system conjugative DNA transfer family protein [Ruminococcus sp.]|nr:type IV secretory system conjugative DNA transfer family protein [Ruminococcus sp.]
MSEVKLNIARAHFSGNTVLSDGSLVGYGRLDGSANDLMTVIGAAGSGKSRSVVIPNILAATGSMYIADMKGSLYSQCAAHLRALGIQVRRFNFVSPGGSMKYNPLEPVRTTNDILKLAHQLVYLGPGSGRDSDPFWDRAAEMLLSAIIGYIVEGGKEVEPSLTGVIRFMSYIDPDAMEEHSTCQAERLFKSHKLSYFQKTGKQSWAYQQFEKYLGLSHKTFSCVMATLHGILAPLDTEEIRSRMDGRSFDMTEPARKKTAVFIEISDTDRSKDVLVNLFFSQAMNTLCEYADSSESKRLPMPVRFILDDFGTCCKIDGFENMISNIRSRGISAMLMLQSLAQLRAGYGAHWETITDNCDTTIYLGGSNLETADYIARLVNKPMSRIIGMPLRTCWIFRRGESPYFAETVDLSSYDLSMFRFVDSARTVLPEQKD